MCLSRRRPTRAGSVAQRIALGACCGRAWWSRRTRGSAFCRSERVPADLRSETHARARMRNSEGGVFFNNKGHAGHSIVPTSGNGLKLGPKQRQRDAAALRVNATASYALHPDHDRATASPVRMLLQKRDGASAFSTSKIDIIYISLKKCI